MENVNNKMICGNSKYGTLGVENESVIKSAIELTHLNVEFSSKPLIFGGLAMEYYGLRKHGNDIDLLITNKDYQLLSDKYPDERIDIWGNLGVNLEKYSFFRSIGHLDYRFYAVEAVEHEDFMVISFERLFFMAAAAMRSEPNVQKRKDDFELIFWSNYDKYKNSEYIQYTEEHRSIYENVPNGTIYGGKYPGRKS